MPRDVSVIGPLNIDLLMVGEAPRDLAALAAWSGPAQMEMVAAGSVGYFVSDLAKLGLDVAVCSCVPDDPLGAFILDALQRDGVETSAVQRTPGTLTGIGVYMLLFGSRKRPLAYRMPTHPGWPPALSSAQAEALLDARALHCGGYLHFADLWHGVAVELFRAARARGLFTSLDSQFPLTPLDPPWMAAMEDILPSVQLLLCDETEARNLAGLEDLPACAARLRAAGPEIVVIKQGAQGATCYGSQGAHHQPAVTLGPVVDTIGAGDAFDAGLLYGRLQGWDLARSAALAARVAGHTVTAVGGSKGFPRRGEVESILG